MKKNLLMLVVLSMVAMVTMGEGSCTNWGWNMANIFPQPKESICSTIPEGESFICQRLRNPEFTHSVLYISNAALLDSMNLEGIEREEEVINDVIWYIDQPSISYAMFEKYVLEKSQSLVVIAAASELSMFQFNNNPILPADRDMIKWSLNRTKGLIDIAKKRKSG